MLLQWNPSLRFTGDLVITVSLVWPERKVRVDILLSKNFFNLAHSVEIRSHFHGLLMTDLTFFHCIKFPATVEIIHCKLYIYIFRII